ncbi:hypothetical protein H5410_032001, partial [Solanum commersonii]
QKPQFLGCDFVNMAQESEWAKAEVVVKAKTQCSRETELIRERNFTFLFDSRLLTAPLGLDPNPFDWVILLFYDHRHLNWKLYLD